MNFITIGNEKFLIVKVKKLREGLDEVTVGEAIKAGIKFWDCDRAIVSPEDRSTVHFGRLVPEAKFEDIASSSNGKTSDSGSENLGSTPKEATNAEE